MTAIEEIETIYHDSFPFAMQPREAFVFWDKNMTPNEQ
jgi:hypothetical protein